MTDFTTSGENVSGASAESRNDDLKTKTEDLAKETKDVAKAKASEFKDKADREARSRTETAGERLERVSRSLDRSADDLENDEEWAADALHTAAGQLSNFAQSIKGKSLSSMAGDARTLARKDPGLFYGACAAAGLALGRFMTATAPKPQTAEPEADSAPTPAIKPETPKANGDNYGVR
ncbi:MAG: hypothetical protein WA989_15635 [Henriciella sp.]|uniref:hypothetical protein n=1 Tax=Henriciella sp. TaxID=1968823 RepID=UPI003C7823D7